jgi:DnaK suppressor protein
MEPLDPRPEAIVDPASMRSALLTERQRAVTELSETVQAPGQMTYGSQAAAASQVFAQQRDLALHDRSQAQLELVEAALARLDDGTYGDCLRCGSPIAPGRLEALPWAAHCIACQAIVDRERR